MKLLRALGAFIALAVTALPLLPAPASAAGSATLSLVPSSGNFATGATVRVAVHVTTGADAVNAVQANFKYPENLLEFSSIDPNGSAFDIGAPSKGGDGEVKIARGALKPVSGNVLVATIVFKAIGPGTAKVDVAAGSAIPRASDSHDVLGTRSGASFKLTGVAIAGSQASSQASSGGHSGSAPLVRAPSPKSAATGLSALLTGGWTGPEGVYLLGLLLLVLIFVGWLLWRRKNHGRSASGSSGPIDKN